MLPLTVLFRSDHCIMYNIVSEYLVQQGNNFQGSGSGMNQVCSHSLPVPRGVCMFWINRK